jgi:hypothetical protein
LKNWTCDDRYDNDDDYYDDDDDDDYNGDGDDDDDDDNSKSQVNVYTRSSILLTNPNNSHTQNTKCLRSSKQKQVIL